MISKFRSDIIEDTRVTPMLKKYRILKVEYLKKYKILKEFQAILNILKFEWGP